MSIANLSDETIADLWGIIDGQEAVVRALEDAVFRLNDLHERGERAGLFHAPQRATGWGVVVVGLMDEIRSYSDEWKRKLST